jgi:hypothetical protein
MASYASTGTQINGISMRQDMFGAARLFICEISTTYIAHHRALHQLKILESHLQAGTLSLGLHRLQGRQLFLQWLEASEDKEAALPRIAERLQYAYRQDVWHTAERIADIKQIARRFFQLLVPERCAEQGEAALKMFNAFCHIADSPKVRKKKRPRVRAV